MSTLVVLAAGRGTRMGRAGQAIHKALLPVDGRAVISHVLELTDAHPVICVGYRGDQIRDYVKLAHPKLDVEFVEVEGWDQPGAGPGASLLAARDAVGDDDLMFAPCDTLWKSALAPTDRSWVALAPVPAGTAPERWCRMTVEGARVIGIHDKSAAAVDGYAWTGLANIAHHDLCDFWAHLEAAQPIHGEHQISSGLRAVPLRAVVGEWTDVGDEAAYLAEVGYDILKPDEATWVLPDEGRVVKFWTDPGIAARRAERAVRLGPVVPRLAAHTGHMLAYDYVPGISAYDAVEADLGAIERILAWAREHIWHPVDMDLTDACLSFYRDKTFARLAMLPPDLRDRCYAALDGMDWMALARGAEPSTFHGDLAFNNIIAVNGGFVAIDWRQDFAGSLEVGDRRYDLAKLLTSCVVHWDRARLGDFEPWDIGPTVARRFVDDQSVGVIAALSLLNSAPLHAAPLDSILVDRGCRLLEKFL